MAVFLLPCKTVMTSKAFRWYLLRTVEICGDVVGVLVRAGEHEELEAGIGGRQVLYVYLARVGGAHEYVREKALADGEA